MQPLFCNINNLYDVHDNTHDTVILHSMTIAHTNTDVNTCNTIFMSCTTHS